MSSTSWSKDKVARDIADFAATLASEKGHPGLRLAARVLADSLQAGTADPSPIPEMQAQTWRDAEASPPPPQEFNGEPPTDVLSPFCAPEKIVLRTPMDAENCGEFSFSLYNAQLIISMLGTGGGVGGEYDVPSLPLHSWTHLIGRGQTPLPILVFRDHGEITAQVGNVPAHPGYEAHPRR